MNGDGLEHKLIAEFLTSNAAIQVLDRLRTFPDRLTTAAQRCGLVRRDCSFDAQTRDQAFAFLALVINLGTSSGGAYRFVEEQPLIAVEPTTIETDRRTGPLQTLVDGMDGFNVAVLPLIMVSLEAQRRFCLSESILVKVTAADGDVNYLDMAGRSYRDVDAFLGHSAFPFGILCYLEPEQVFAEEINPGTLNYKMVGRRLLFLSAADAMLVAFNIVSCLGLLLAASRFVLPLGLLAVGSSLYLIARGVWNFIDAQRFGGLRATRTTVLSIILTMLNFATFVFVSLPYSVGLRDHLNEPSVVLLFVCAGMDIAWILTQPPLHTYGWTHI